MAMEGQVECPCCGELWTEPDDPPQNCVHSYQCLRCDATWAVGFEESDIGQTICSVGDLSEWEALEDNGLIKDTF